MENYCLSLSSHVAYLENKEEKKIILKGASGDIEIPSVTEGLFFCFDRLARENATEYELLQILEQKNEIFNLTILYYYIELLLSQGMLSVNLISEGDLIARLIPSTSQFKFREHDIDIDQEYTLSRFLYIRKNANAFIVESPMAHATVHLYSAASLSLLHNFSTWTSLRKLNRKYAHLSEETIWQLVNLLMNIKGICPIDACGQPSEDSDDNLNQWEFHDLLFHSRCRMGRYANPSGGTYPFLDKIAPTPPIKELPKYDLAIDLYRPDIAKLKQSDISLTSAIEDRKSTRKYGNTPVTDKQLGEFLYRTMRLREPKQKLTDGVHLYDTVSKPYPSGGASYELELYITVAECLNIPKGIYYYNGRDHQLLRISTNELHQSALLTGAYHSAAKIGHPQVLITINARFKRLSWKYRSMVYSTILKNTGALYQTMYLVATSLRLGACGLGNGNAELSANAFGNNYFDESSVGEFMIGTFPDEEGRVSEDVQP